MKPPFAWLRKISSHLQSYDRVPLFGNAPFFDWERFSSLAASRFGIQSFSVRAEKQQWLSADEIKTGLSGSLVTIPIKVAPLAGSVFWMMPREEIGKLTSWMLHGKAKTKPISSELLAEGFYRYLLLQMLDVGSAVEPFTKLSPVLSEESPLPETDAFCIDIEIAFENRSCWGRLAIDPEFQKSWIHHFSQFSLDHLPSHRAQSVELTMGVKVGAVLLRHEEWKELKEGDVVLLDQGSYDPRKAQGAAYFTLGATPLFQVKIKQNKLELLDYAFVYEEEMGNKKTPEPADSSGPSETFPAVEGEAMAIKEMPIYVTVELARLRVTLEKLMHLTPGNTIELPIRADQPVQLTVNGQVIGRAELVHMGEALAIRILEI